MCFGTFSPVHSNWNAEGTQIYIHIQICSNTQTLSNHWNVQIENSPHVERKIIRDLHCRLNRDIEMCPALLNQLVPL